MEEKQSGVRENHGSAQGVGKSAAALPLENHPGALKIISDGI